MKEHFDTYILASFSNAFLSIALCIYKENIICWGEVFLVLGVSFISIFLILTSIDYTRKIFSKKQKIETYERIIIVTTIVFVLNVMYLGDIWFPPGTYYLIEIHTPEIKKIAYAYSFFFEIYKNVGVLLIVIYLILFLFKKMNGLLDTGYHLLILWFLMKIIFMLSALPAVYKSM